MGTVLRISGNGALTITFYGLNAEQATALCQLLTSSAIGADVHSAPIAFQRNPSAPTVFPEVVATVSPRQLRDLHLLAGDSRIPTGLAESFHSLLDNYLRSDYKITCGGKVLDLGSRTHIMGILNVTPDSFSDGGHFVDAATALTHARAMTSAGADIIDIGGESTRPGAAPVVEEEELRRIIPVIERLSSELAIPISVDTYKSSVAKKAIKAGAGIVNDISGLRFSPDMADVVADSDAAVVIMHMKGTPRDMQQNPVYDDIISEIMAYFEESIQIAVKAGVDREKIFIDPGIGFGKTLEHNLVLLDRLDQFRELGRPIVLGTSRKKFIGTVLDVPEPEQRVDGTAATVAIGIQRGARVVRVHDVARMAHVVKMTDAILNVQR